MMDVRATAGMIVLSSMFSGHLRNDVAEISSFFIYLFLLCAVQAAKTLGNLSRCHPLRDYIFNFIHEFIKKQWIFQKTMDFSLQKTMDFSDDAIFVTATTVKKFRARF